jgi:hypothetical protein
MVKVSVSRASFFDTCFAQWLPDVSTTFENSAPVIHQVIVCSVLFYRLLVSAGLRVPGHGDLLPRYLHQQKAAASMPRTYAI